MTPGLEAPVRAPRTDELSLAELLDRLIGDGVALQGDVVLSVAGVDLVWLGLRAVLAGADLAPPGAGVDLPHHLDGKHAAGPMGPPRAAARGATGSMAGELPTAGTGGGRDTRVEVDDGRVEEGLVRLVLSVVELLRQLMEGQALRRMDAGSLSEAQLERVGTALMRLSKRMEELQEFFGLTDDDLELHLGNVKDLG